MATVKDFLQVKGHQVWSVSPSTPLKDALALMAEHRIGALPVLDHEQVVGILSERDYTRAVIHQPEVTLETPVSEIMTSPVYYVTPAQSIDEVMALMTAKRFRHLPILKDGKLTGIISIGDVIKYILSEKEAEIKDLEETLRIQEI